MLEPTMLAAFFLAAVTAYFSPGPNNLMLMTSSAKFGLAATMPHAIGIIFGFPVMLFVVGLGLGEVFTAYPVLSTIMRYAAAAYFLWMAWTMLGISIGPASGSERPMRAYEAALFQWINPKAWATAVSFAAFFVPPGEGRIVNLLVLSIGSAMLSPMSCALWMVGGRALITFLQRTGGERFLGGVLAALMLIAVVLFLI
ncbi:LysE family translocator [Pelagibacterium luteolum]|uniref:Threonine/homoserine/homoserine lactone efflux protein n=1 Tax=Pelagibacterium luteolum TaxID=440168 RepID=A0A1G7UFM8_9HYPH|nr:LysE family translocator [Pelagibacterium luteolum]SDG46284.1 Threonine/homoserine/homoserine lactone efflux protein [Pelagibacterium luteolum]